MKPAQVAYLEGLGGRAWAVWSTPENVWSTPEKAAWEAGKWPTVEHRDYDGTPAVRGKAAGA